jgi:two-component system chemotaxis sensor kinase CheA
MTTQRSFRTKLIAGALAPLVIAGALQALYSVVSQRREAIAVLEAKAHALTGLLVNVAGPSIALDDPKGVDEGLGYIEHDPDFEFAMAVAPDGKPIAFRGPSATRSARIAAGAATTVPTAFRDGDTLIASYPVVSKGVPIAQLVVGLRTASAAAHAAVLTAWAAVISLVGIAVAVAVVVALAGRIARRNREMTKLLDNVEQGFLNMHRDGTLASERSAVATRLLGEYRPGQKLWGAIAPIDPTTAAWLDLGWGSVLDGELPRELTLHQLPGKLTIGERSYRIEYKPTIAGDAIGDTLVVITDKTAELARERAEASERDLLRFVERMTRDRLGFAEFVDETDRLIRGLEAVEPTASDAVKRDLHTLKGNCAIYGLTQIADKCHELEDWLAGNAALDHGVVAEIAQAWREINAKLDRMFGGQRVAGLDVNPDDLAELRAAIGHGLPLGMIEYLIRGWSLERARSRLEWLGDQARRLSGLLGKGSVTVDIADHGVRLDAIRFRPLWSALTHVIRNAIDHGIEPSAERLAQGKPEHGRIDLVTRRDELAVVIELGDDGRGVDWEAVRTRARDAGQPYATRDDLVAAMLSDGITTKADVTETSGRGVGLAVVREACAKLGGKLEVDSERGHGTRFRFRFDLDRQHRVSSRIPREFDAAPTGR